MALKTITEAVAVNASKLIIIKQDTSTVSDSSRQIPYRELYAGRTAVMEDPVDRIQQTLLDELEEIS